MSDVLVPLIVFLFVAAIILVPKWMRMREREKLIDAMRQMSEKGATPSSELLEALQLEALGGARKPREQPSADRDMRQGATYLAIACALVFLAVALHLDHRGGQGPVIGVAAFPAFIGLTRLGFWWASRSKRDI